jgi:arginyl-tRNA synthetase
MAYDEQLKNALRVVLSELGMTEVAVALEHPAELVHGDYATNVAMVAAKKAGKNPRALAEEIATLLRAKADPMIAAVEVAGPGFINFRLSKEYFDRALADALAEGESYGENQTLMGKKVIVEYTDPNPFKEFHIGHLMSNAIGESISQLIEVSGAETKRACYQGDKGLHVAKTVWGYRDLYVKEGTPAHDLTAASLGRAYAHGAQSYEKDEEIKKEIIALNASLYNGTCDETSQFIYDKGRAVSLDYFETIYKRLGTNHGDGKAFNFYFFESETGVFGKELVLSRPDIFVSSDGAIVYKGDEAKGLHTRVFINKEGLPTYEAKELGLSKIKFDHFPYDVSVVVTANEVNDYFKVLLDAMKKVFPELAAKTEHIGHGVMKLSTGKMSSRTGDVITATSFIDDIKEKARAKIANVTLVDEEKARVAEMVAIGAIKYTILRQDSTKDIIFDAERSLSFEGDSGPYLQYTAARITSLLVKAGARPVDAHAGMSTEVSPLHKLVVRFPEVLLRAQEERAPHHVATYLIELARAFNTFYGNTIVLDGAPDEPYKLAVCTVTRNVVRKGLATLGISTPERM